MDALHERADDWCFHRRDRRTRRPQLEGLEVRLVLNAAKLGAGDVFMIQGPLALGGSARYPITVDGLPAASDIPVLDTVALSGGTGTSNGAVQAATGLAIPALNSLLGAKATLYLDFAGDTVASWVGFSNITIPAFDTDSNVASLCQTEVDTITNIWRIVAENYAPFNINVTTVDPRTVSGLTGGVSQIDIGGNGSWAGGSYGGIAQVGGIDHGTAANPARGFVFPANLGNGNAWYTAESATHESGHTMGLQHQSAYSGATKTAEYQTGLSDGTAPIMGCSYYATRGMWWYGQSSVGSATYQNDVAVIASNSFGYRPLATGSTITTAEPVSLNAGLVSATGILESMTQADMWSFTTTEGPASFTVAAPNKGSLHPRFEVLDSTGAVVVDWVDTDSSSVSWSGTLGAGTYFLVVGSHGPSKLATPTNYGFDIGSYDITGSLTDSVTSIAGPSNLTAAANATTRQINLAWTDNTTDETNYLVERSTDGGKTFSQIGSLPAGAVSFTDSGLTPGTTYTYRVRAFSSSLGLYSSYSNQVSATIIQVPAKPAVPAAPSNFTATPLNSGQLELTWLDNSNNETGFVIERATFNKQGKMGGWVQIARVGANTTSFLDTRVMIRTSYAYRIRSYNSVGYSAYVSANPGVVTANAHSAAITRVSATPVAPSNFTATPLNSGPIELTWLDKSDNETNFVIERATFNKQGKMGGWVQIARAGANTTGFLDTRVMIRTSYAYRIRSYNSVGYSAYVSANSGVVTTNARPVKAKRAFGQPLEVGTVPQITSPSTARTISPNRGSNFSASAAHPLMIHHLAPSFVRDQISPQRSRLRTVRIVLPS